MVKYLIGIIVLIFLFSTTSFYSFAQIANTKRESRNDRKEKKVDEIYQIETSNINSLLFAEEFHLRYEKYLKESIRKQQKAALADALFAFGEGLQGHTANQNVMASPKFKDERKKIYEDWINEVNSRSEQYPEQNLRSSNLVTVYEQNDPEIITKDDNTLTYIGVNSDHWIEKNWDGEIIKLEDGSLWEVLDYDVINSMLWLPIDDVVVFFNKKDHGEFCYQMKNGDEVIKVKLLKQ